MNAVINKIPALVDEELKAANVVHSSFHNQHEGYAVLLEEVEEVQAEMSGMEFQLRQLWGCVKHDDTLCAIGWAEGVERQAIRLAAEAIQVAAMARKFRATNIKIPKGEDAEWANGTKA